MLVPQDSPGREIVIAESARGSTRTHDEVESCETACAYTVLDVDPGDRWVQDLVEFGVFKLPGPGRLKSEIKVMVILPRAQCSGRAALNDTLDDLVELARERNCCIVQLSDLDRDSDGTRETPGLGVQGNDEQGSGTSQNSGGNLEVTCEILGESYPVFGVPGAAAPDRNPNLGGHQLNEEYLCWLKAQGHKKVIEVDVGWLSSP
jgi:hypothetical protein